jgi:hypothetical protein
MRKIQNLKSIQFSNDFAVISNQLLEWNKKKPIPIISKMIEAVNSWFFYTHELETTQWHWEKSLEQYRTDKIRAIQRARKAEKKLELVEQELKKYKKTYG